MDSTNKIFDAFLVLQYQSGKKESLTLLVNRYHGKLCKQAFWITRDMDTSKDIVQDCWSIIARKMESLRDPNSFGSWAMRIVTRKSLDFVKREKKTHENLEAYYHESRIRENEENKDSDHLKLLKALNELPNNQQVVLRLFYTEAYSLREISTILDISVGTVKSRLFHAREKLKTILKNKNDEK